MNKANQNKNILVDLSKSSNMTVDKIINFYESQRKIMPKIVTPGLMQRASNLLEISKNFDVFIFDSFGVLNTGNKVNPNVISILQKLNFQGKLIFALTNGATYPTKIKFKTFKQWGMPFKQEHVISSRDCLKKEISNMKEKFWGVIGAPMSDVNELGVRGLIINSDLTNIDECNGLIFLGSDNWDKTNQKRLYNYLRHRPLPIYIANPDIIAPTQSGFLLQPGYWGWLLREIKGVEIKFFGKPYRDVYDLLIKKINSQLNTKIDYKRIAMVGDSLHTDILGGSMAKFSTILVTDYGFFANGGYMKAIKKTKIQPDWIIPIL